MNAHRDSIVLASASPRRLELLRQIGVHADVRPVDIDETPLPGEAPDALALRLARAKALAGAAVVRPGARVLAADTVVELDGELFGKPRDRDEALHMWARLGGRTHRVLTAIALAVAGEPVVRGEALSVTEVSMRALSAREAADYWDSGEPCDKAGGYGIQGRGAVFIEHIRGSYSGVMGLPLYETARLLHSDRPGGDVAGGSA